MRALPRAAVPRLLVPEARNTAETHPSRDDCCRHTACRVTVSGGGTVATGSRYVARLHLEEGKVRHETTARLDRDRLVGGLRGTGGGLLGREGVHRLVRPGRPAPDDQLAVGDAHHRGVSAAAEDGHQRPDAGCGGDRRGQGRRRPRRPGLRWRRRVRPDPAEPAHRPVAQRAADAAGHRPRTDGRGRRPRPVGAPAPGPAPDRLLHRRRRPAPPLRAARPRRADGRNPSGALRKTAHRARPGRCAARRQRGPRDDAITLADEEVEFVTEIAEASIERTFELEDMVVNGRLEL